MEIFQISSEITPLAKVGGLGDVLMGFSRELLKKGHSVLPIIPAYGAIDRAQLRPLNREEWFDSRFRDTPIRASLSYYEFDTALPVALLDTEDGFFRNEKTIYDAHDGASAYLLFCRAIVDWMIATHQAPDIVHLHDWPTAILPTVYQTVTKQEPPFRTVFTVHNFEYQGRCSWDDLSQIGLYQHNVPDPSRLADPVHDCLNLVKAGLLSADVSTTVSPTYAQEVRTQEQGNGLQEVLSSLDDRFIGILNGLDSTYWNPETDILIPKQYGLSSKPRPSSRVLEGVRFAKKFNKKHLFQSIGIPLIEGAPLIASVTRLVPQKGTSLIKDLCYRSEEMNTQCLVLGSVPDHQTEQDFLHLDSFLRARGRGAVFLANNEAFAHKAYAAADMFVVPSIIEPCGLTQLIALKYGTIPIVRKTGGLADTIIDLDSTSGIPNGFMFESADVNALVQTTHRALKAFHNLQRWEELMVQGMVQDHSWTKPGNAYCAVYAGDN